MNIRYLSLRLVRHFLPQRVAHYLLKQRLFITPGLETTAPESAVARYQGMLTRVNQTLAGKRVMVFGYGGNFAIACDLLQAGAAYVTLLDKYAAPDDVKNRLLLPRFEKYLSLRGEEIVTNPAYIDVLSQDIRDLAPATPYDIILSNSVFEHLDDVPGTTAALAGLLQLDGCMVHYVDLRDHYFKYPFEMLTFSERTWKRWLNPGSNLNRYRVKDYQAVFDHLFESVEVTVLERDFPNFEKTRSRILQEFLTGDIAQDAVTLICILAHHHTLESHNSLTS